MRAKVFVGYTEAGARFGKAMTDELKRSVDAVPWQSAFDVGESIFSEVLNQPYQYDFGVFVFTPDDFQIANERIFLASNLVFELGVFIGVKGRKRAFPVWPKGFDLPSDLQGVFHPRFDPNAEDIAVAFERACEQILSLIRKPHFDDPYFIMSKETGRCLDVEDWRRSLGGRIIQWRYHGGKNQLWSLERYDDQWFKITSVHSGKCLQVVDGSHDDEALIEQGSFEGLEHQQWSLTRGPHRAYIIKARHSRKVLAVKEGRDGERNLVVQSTWHEKPDKLWWISQEARI